MTLGSHDRRAITHILAGIGAFLLFHLERREAIALAIVAVLVNRFVLYRHGIARRLFRDGNPWRDGIVLYPVMILLAIAILPYPAAPSCVWAVLAGGDGAASLIGRRFGKKKWPWSVRRSPIGTAAFVIGGTVLSYAALVYGGIPPRHALLVGGAATLAAAAVEAAPLAIDDNVSIVVVAGAVATALL